MTFSSLKGYVSVANNSNLNLSGEITLEVWAKPGTGLGSSQAIIHKGGKTSPSNYQYRLGLTADNHWSGTVYVGAQSIVVTDPGIPSAGRWDHLVLTRSGNTLTLYVNGVSVATAPVVGALNTGNGILAFGRRGTDSADYFTGSIDEVAIYNRALTTSQILAHYSAAMGGGG